MPGIVFTGNGQIHTDPATGERYIHETAYLVGDNSIRYDATETIDPNDPEGICHAEFRLFDKIESYIKNKHGKQK